MCSVCHCNPCRPQCPNAPADEPIYYCEHCNKGLYDGDSYYDIDSVILCEDCISEHKHTIEVIR